MSENIRKLTSYMNINWSLIFTLIVSSFVIAVSSQVSIPLPNGVPMTLQTFSVALTGFCLYKDNKGLKSIIAYLFLGMVGFPVFAQGKGGFTSLIGLTGGFLIGFIFLVYFCQKSKSCKTFWSEVSVSLIGLILLHICGVLQYSFLTSMNFINVSLLVSIPFLLKDCLSVLLALIVSNKLNRA